MTTATLKINYNIAKRSYEIKISIRRGSNDRYETPCNSTVGAGLDDGTANAGTYTAYTYANTYIHIYSYMYINIYCI